VLAKRTNDIVLFVLVEKGPLCLCVSVVNPLETRVVLFISFCHFTLLIFASFCERTFENIIMPGFWNFLTRQWSTLPLYRRDLRGQTVIVTGANVGLGLETAKHLATMQPEHIILGVRDADHRIEMIAGELQGYRGLSVWELDLSKFESVRAFAKRFEETGWDLNILVSNAGVALYNWKHSYDGNELSLQTNHLSNYLLISLLRPSLKKTAAKGIEPRIVVVGSNLHYKCKFEEKRYDDVITALNDIKRTTNIRER